MRSREKSPGVQPTTRKILSQAMSDSSMGHSSHHMGPRTSAPAATMELGVVAADCDLDDLEIMFFAPNLQFFFDVIPKF